MASIETKGPELPSVYEPVHLETADNLAEAALTLAQSGAPDSSCLSNKWLLRTYAAREKGPKHTL